MTRPIVLILTRAEDAHAPPVIQELRRRGVQPVCLDLAELPTLLAHPPLTATRSTSVPNWQGLYLCPREASWKMEEVLSVWWRRPRFPQATDAYAPAVQTFIQHETARGFLGVLAERPVLLTSSGQPQRAAPSASPPCWWLRPCWVNQRERLQAAEYKPAPHAVDHGPGSGASFSGAVPGASHLQGAGAGAVASNAPAHRDSGDLYPASPA